MDEGGDDAVRVLVELVRQVIGLAADLLGGALGNPNHQQKYVHDFGSILNFIEYLEVCLF